MDYKKLYTCCFFGHRKIPDSLNFKSMLFETVEKLIVENQVDTFLFGSKSQFDDICYIVTTELKEKYPHIKRVYVRAEYPNISDEYRQYLLDRYEDTYYPKKIISAGKATYVERNFEMIDNSSYCICYYDSDYSPEKLKEKPSKSGTDIAYRYANMKKKTIFNLKSK